MKRNIEWCSCITSKNCYTPHSDTAFNRNFQLWNLFIIPLCLDLKKIINIVTHFFYRTQIEINNTLMFSFLVCVCCRLSLLEEWRGIRDDELSTLSGIPGCIFVHASGFIGGNQTCEGVLEMARRTLQHRDEMKEWWLINVKILSHWLHHQEGRRLFNTIRRDIFFWRHWNSL